MISFLSFFFLASFVGKKLELQQDPNVLVITKSCIQQYMPGILNKTNKTAHYIRTSYIVKLERMKHRLRQETREC